MTGTRIDTRASANGVLDIFATLSNDAVVRILTGVKACTGTWETD